MTSGLKTIIATLAGLSMLGGVAIAGDVVIKNDALKDDVVISRQHEQNEKGLIESVKDLYVSFYNVLEGKLSSEEFEEKKKRFESLDKLVDAYDFNKSDGVNNFMFYIKHNLYVYSGLMNVGGDEIPTFCIGTDVKDIMDSVDLGNRIVSVHRVVFGKTLVPMLQNHIHPNTLISWCNSHTVFQEKEVFEAITGDIYDRWNQYEAANSLKKIGKVDNPEWDVIKQLMHDEFSEEYLKSKNRSQFILNVYPRLMHSKFIHEAEHIYDPETDPTLREYNSYRKEIALGSDQKYNLAFYLEREGKDNGPHAKAGTLIIDNIIGYIHKNQNQYQGIIQKKDLYRLSKEQISEIAKKI